MTGHWETFEHTADVGLAGDAATLGELFEAMAQGLAEFICRPDLVKREGVRELRVQAGDVEALLVDFLGEVANVIQTDRFMVASVKVSRMDDNAVKAELAGEPYDPRRHRYRHEVKAVTYHRLKVAQENGKWIARVILDV